MPRISHPIALTGPAAAAIHGLDGFRDLLFKHRYASPYNAHGGSGIIRTRHWQTPQEKHGELLATIPIVLRHLNAFPDDLCGLTDGVSAQDRVELATEHARRLGHVVTVPFNSQASGDQMLRIVRRLSGNEPHTDSYAETRSLQWFRTQNLHPWRQLQMSIGGKRYRIDFGFSLGPRFRPLRIRPSDLLICHIDGREFHEGTFELDYRKRNAFDRAGFHHIELTPNEIAHHPQRALATIMGAIRRANGSHPRRISLTPKPIPTRTLTKSRVA
jgi:very-short-patch-repair endonuclease